MKALYTGRAAIRSLLANINGNFGIITALMLPVLLAVGGIAVDVSNMLLARSQMQEATDAAALATATALSNGVDAASAQAFAKQFVSGQMTTFLGSNPATKAALQKATDVAITTTTDASSGTKYAVAVSSSYALGLTPMMGLFGYKTTNIATGSTSTSGQEGGKKTALSMELVLDQSGSMSQATDTATMTCTKTKRDGSCQSWTTGYVSKIDALKKAAGSLFDTLDKADPKRILVRTGAISYNSQVTDWSDMKWGTSDARSFVDAMSAEGGTNAMAAMSKADLTVKKIRETDNESKEHARKDNKTVSRYILLMTDGEMTGNNGAWSAASDKAVRLQCNTAKADGIELFTVGFMAPPKGISLLKYCASSASNYYEADSMDDLVKAFSSIAKAATRALTLMTK